MIRFVLLLTLALVVPRAIVALSAEDVESPDLLPGQEKSSCDETKEQEKGRLTGQNEYTNGRVYARKPEYRVEWNSGAILLLVREIEGKDAKTMQIVSVTPDPFLEDSARPETEVMTYLPHWRPITGTFTIDRSSNTAYIAVGSQYAPKAYRILQINLQDGEVTKEIDLPFNMIPFALTYHDQEGETAGLYAGFRFVILPPVTADVFSVGRVDISTGEITAFNDFDHAKADAAPHMVVDPCRDILYTYLRRRDNHVTTVFEFDLSSPELTRSVVPVQRMHDVITPHFDYTNRTMIALTGPHKWPYLDAIAQVDYQNMKNGPDHNRNGQSFLGFAHGHHFSFPLEGVSAYDTHQYRLYQIMHRVESREGIAHHPDGLRGLGNREGINGVNARASTFEEKEHSEPDGSKPFFLVCYDARRTPAHEPWVHFAIRIPKDKLPFDMAISPVGRPMQEC